MRYSYALCATLAFVSAPLCAQEEGRPGPTQPSAEKTGVEVLSGLDFEEGELATGEKVEGLSVPIGIRATIGRLSATAQLPYTRVTAPANVVVPSGPLGLPILVDPTKPAENRKREGIGDLRLGLAYDLPVKGIVASVRSGVKLPTASTAEGLGTGETDYWVGADISKTVGVLTPFAGISYTVAGDPENFELRNSFSGQAGAAVRLGSSVSAHLGYGYVQSASKAAEDEQHLFGGASTALSNGVSLGFYGSAGLEGAADIGAGFSLGVKLN